MQGWSAGASRSAMANKLPWMPLYGRDMLLDGKVRALFTDDRMKWWYLVLLLQQWDEGAVPLDGNACRGIVGPSMGTPAKVWHDFTELIPEFFPPIDEYLGQNKRLEEIRMEHVGAADRRVEKARLAGLASGQARRKQNSSPTQGEPELNSSSNPSATQRATQSELGRTNQNQNQNQTPHNPKESQVDADASAQFVAHYMGVIRRAWPGQTRQEMTTNASILKQMFGKVSPELDAAICGLPIARPNTRPSMRLLWSKEIRDEVWTDSVRAHYQSMKEPRERGGEDRGAEHISETLARLSQARVS